MGVRVWGGNGSSSYLSLTAEFPDVICHTSDFVTTTVRAVSSVRFLSKKLFLSDTRKEKFVFFWHRDSNNSICRDSEDYKNDQPTSQSNNQINQPTINQSNNQINESNTLVFVPETN